LGELFQSGLKGVDEGSAGGILEIEAEQVSEEKGKGT